MEQISIQTVLLIIDEQKFYISFNKNGIQR
jgi:hypothetical protein